MPLGGLEMAPLSAAASGSGARSCIRGIQQAALVRERKEA